MQDFTDLAFLTAYATLSLATFAVLHHLIVVQTKEPVKEKGTSRR